MINHYKKPLILLLGCLSLFSCTKETVIAPAIPSAISELRAWTQKTDPLKLASSIAWEAAIPIKLSDSVSAYAAPVRNTYPAAISPDFMEFITFELAGKRYGLYKSYRRLNETDMEIIIQSIEGKTLKAGFISKKKALIPKGKSVSMREMNLDMEVAFIYEYIMGILLNNVNVYGTGGGGGYIWGYSRPNSMNYYGNYEGGKSSRGGGEGEQANTDFYDRNYVDIQDNLTKPCFKKVLNDLRSKNLYGIVGDMVSEFNNNKMIKLNFAQAPFLEKNGKPLNGQYNTLTNTITLSESELENASQEFIACVIIHEMFHACINTKREIIDHTIMYNQYVESAGKYLNLIYGIDKYSAENLFLDGLRDADGYKQVSLLTTRWQEIKFDILAFKYNLALKGHYCN
jgi:hypothetical protein